MTFHFLYVPIILSLLPALAEGGERDIEVLPGTTVDRLTMAFAGALQMPTMFREVHLRISLPGNTTYNGVLLLARETGSGRYWWTLLNTGTAPIRLSSADWFASHAAIFVTENAIVTFWTTVRSQLSVVEHKGLAAGSIDEAQQKVTAEIQRRTGEYQHGKIWLPDPTTVKLSRDLIPMAFWVRPFQTAVMSYTTKVVSAGKDGKNWKLVLRDQWDQELILDESYGVVSSRRLDSTAPDAK